MSWLIRHRWFVLGLLASLLVSLSAVYVFQPLIGMAAWLQRTALYFTVLRLAVVGLLFTLAFPLALRVIEKYTRDSDYTQLVKRLRWRLLAWYLVIELIFMLGHLG